MQEDRRETNQEAAAVGDLKLRGSLILLVLAFQSRVILQKRQKSPFICASVV